MLAPSSVTGLLVGLLAWLVNAAVIWMAVAWYRRAETTRQAGVAAPPQPTYSPNVDAAVRTDKVQTDNPYAAPTTSRWDEAAAPERASPKDVDQPSFARACGISMAELAAAGASGLVGALVLRLLPNIGDQRTDPFAVGIAVGALISTAILRQLLPTPSWATAVLVQVRRLAIAGMLAMVGFAAALFGS